MPELSLDWFLFALRLAFVVLLYLFLYQVVRVTFKDLINRAEQPGAGAGASPGRPPGTVARLLIVDPGSTGYPPGFDLALAPVTMVGRHGTNAVVLEDGSVSGEHAEIALRRGRWWVRDLESTNGTLINGARIDGPTPLGPGDLVQFGRVSGRFDA